MTTQTFTSSTTWLCPAGVFSVAAANTGEGDSGASSFSGNYSGAGGGGGAYAAQTVSVTPGNNYTVRIDSTASVFIGDNATVTANAGTAASGTTPGTGGAASSNTVSFAGGSGGSGLTGTGRGGGGGGGAATASGAGAAGHQGGVGGGGAGGGNGGSGGGSSNGGSPGGSPGGGGGGGGNSGTHIGGAGGGGQVQLTYTVSANTSVTGVVGVITAAGAGGTIAVAPAGTAGAVSVSAPAGVVSVSGDWVIFGTAGLVTAAAPAGSVTIAVPGQPGAVTAAGPSGGILAHVIAPAPVTPPSAFRGAVSRYLARHGTLRVQASARSSSVVTVQAPPLVTWTMHGVISTSARAAWNTRRLMNVPLSGAGEIEVLPVWGLPAPPVTPQIAWHIRSGMAVMTPLLTAYAVTRQARAPRVPGRRHPPGAGGSQHASAQRAAGPPLAWHCHGGVAALASLTWNLRRQATAAAYAAWDTAPGTHGTGAALAVMSWDTAARHVTAAGAVTWNAHALITRTGVAAWDGIQRLAAARSITWSTLLAGTRVRYAAAHRAAAPRVLRRGIRLGGRDARSAAAASQVTCAIRWKARALLIVRAGPVSGGQPAIPGLFQPGLGVPGSPGTAGGVAVPVAWDIRRAVTAAAVMAWSADHKASAASPQAAWNVRKTRTAAGILAWDTRVPVAASAACAYAVTVPGPVLTAVIRWDVLIRQPGPAAVARWDVYRQQFSRTALCGWDINPVMSGTSPAISWRTLASVNPSPRAVSWNTQEHVTAAAVIRWDIIQALSPAAVIAWRLLGLVPAVSPLIQWNTGQPVQGSMRAAAMDEWFTAE